jgi:hypothetical protein
MKLVLAKLALPRVRGKLAARAEERARARGKMPEEAGRELQEMAESGEYYPRLLTAGGYSSVVDVLGMERDYGVLTMFAALAGQSSMVWDAPDAPGWVPLQEVQRVVDGWRAEGEGGLAGLMGPEGRGLAVRERAYRDRPLGSAPDLAGELLAALRSLVLEVRFLQEGRLNLPAVAGAVARVQEGVLPGQREGVWHLLLEMFDEVAGFEVEHVFAGGVPRGVRDILEVRYPEAAFREPGSRGEAPGVGERVPPDLEPAARARPLTAT